MKMNVFCASPNNQYGEHSMREIGDRVPLIGDKILTTIQEADKPLSIKYKVLFECTKCSARGVFDQDGNAIEYHQRSHPLLRGKL